MKQRVIKFRAWNDYPELEEPYMMSWKDLDKADNDGIFLLFDILSGKEKSIIPMQYTGLKDKNGKDIYEGDIIELNHPYKNRKYIGEVLYNKFEFTGDNFYFSHYDNPISLFSEGTENMTVVGNIYEMPFLLQKQTN